MKELQRDHPVSFMGRGYGVSPGGCHYWLVRPCKKRLAA
jgi:hypothetical protein